MCVQLPSLSHAALSHAAEAHAPAKRTQPVRMGSRATTSRSACKRNKALPRSHALSVANVYISKSRTWMLWPTRPDTWKASAGPAQTAFAAVAKAIARFEPVTVGVPPGKEESARTLLHCAGVTIVVIEQDDAWIRDTGPTFVVGCTSCSGKSESQNARQNIRGVDWSFNAWGGELGGCFSSWNKDDAIASTVLGHVASARYKANMVLEVKI